MNGTSSQLHLFLCCRLMLPIRLSLLLERFSTVSPKVGIVSRICVTTFRRSTSRGKAFQGSMASLRCQISVERRGSTLCVNLFTMSLLRYESVSTIMGKQTLLVEW